MTDGTLFYEADWGLNGIHRFASVGELVEFARRQRQNYEWVSKVRGPALGGAVWQGVSTVLDRNINLTKAWANDPQQQTNATEQLKEAFLRHGIPIDGTLRDGFLKALRARRGDEVAACALGVLGGWLPADNYTRIAAAVELANFDAGTNPHTLLPVKEAMAKTRDAMRVAAQRSTAAEDRRQAVFDELVRAQGRLSLAGRRWVRMRLGKAQRDAEARSSATIEELNNVKKQYTELMRLKAPVDYWQEKATEHEAKAVGYRANVKTAAIYGGAAVFAVLGLITWAAIKLPAGTPLAAYASLAAFGALTTTAVLWLVRILVRLFLSQHHLALDARERATMALTYLALTGEGKAEEKDRTLVLTSLFRPTSDGIVKDDAAPDVGLSGLLSKALSK